MVAIAILPCIIDDGDVRRPYPGEATHFYGAYRKDPEGFSEHVVDFYCMDAGQGYQKDRYLVVFWLENDGPYPYVAMNALGMLHCRGETPKAYLDAVLAETDSFSAADHLVSYESLPTPVQCQIQHECRQYVDQPVTA